MKKNASAKGEGKELPIEIDDGKGRERFEEFARKIVAVPKDEIEKEDRQKRAPS